MVDSALNPFRRFVADNNIWFAGRLPETQASISAAEESLGVQLPSDITWLLTTYGYWHATGICSLTDTVTDTLTARDSLGLPHNFVVLYDHHEGGVVLLDTTVIPDTNTHSVYITGWEFVPDDIAEDIVFPSFFDYVKYVLDNERDLIDAADIACSDRDG